MDKQTIAYACDICSCSEYKGDNTTPDVQGVPKWPRCFCGHLAQDHNGNPGLTRSGTSRHVHG